MSRAVDVVEAVYRADSRRVLATLIRLLGDFDLAEEALHEAFAAAVQKWPQDGIPSNPRAWLVSTGRFKAIDTLRRRTRFDASLVQIARDIEARQEEKEAMADSLPGGEEQVVRDDQLRLVFTCCHPLLAPDAQVALTLREVCGLTTEEIARAFLATAPTLAQRIVRAKARIREEKIPYELPARAEIAARLGAVLRVVYLVFNEGYAATAGESLVRQSLSDEAIRLGRLLLELAPVSEVMGLLALMLLHESRRAARAAADGSIILLPDQDRSLWNAALIREGCALVDGAFAAARAGAAEDGGGPGPYAVQAAIAAAHAGSATVDATDWRQIVSLYDQLVLLEPGPVVELNRAVAVGMVEGPAAALRIVEKILERGDLAEYQLAHAVHADLCRRLGRRTEARESYQRALGLARQEPERRFLEQRMEELDTKA